MNSTCKVPSPDNKQIDLFGAVLATDAPRLHTAARSVPRFVTGNPQVTRLNHLFRIALLAGVALLYTLPAHFALAAGGPNPKEIYVQSISYDGDGCPQGSVGTSLSDDRTTFTLIFDRFVASTGPGVPITEAKKNCKIDVNLHLPNGWTYSVSTIDYRGFVQLPAGIRAAQKSNYFFQGKTKNAQSSTTFVGPVSKDYLIRDTIPLTSVVWSSCKLSSPLNINANVQIIGNKEQQAQITIDSIDGKVKHIMGLAFKRC